MFEIKSIPKYITKLLNKWYILVSLFLFFLSLLTLFFPTNNKVSDFIQYINNFSFLIFIMCFFIASYQVWLEVQQELDKIKKNPVDYKVTAKIQKIFIKKRYLTEEDGNKLDQQINKCEDEIKCYENKNLEITSDEHNVANTVPIGKIINNPKFLKSYTEKKSKELDIAYLQKLYQYKEELFYYKHNIIGNIEEWNRTVDKNFSNLYTVDFYIESIGNKSDKNIDVKIQLGSNTYIKNESLENLYCHPRFIEKPKKPDKPSISNLSNLTGLNNTSDLDIFKSTNLNIDNYLKFKEFKEKSLSVNLRDINVGDDIHIFREKVLIELPKKEEIKVIIKSENSNAKIEKTVEFEIEENPIEYFDYLASELEE